MRKTEHTSCKKPTLSHTSNSVAVLNLRSDLLANQLLILKLEYLKTFTLPPYRKLTSLTCVIFQLLTDISRDNEDVIGMVK